MTRASAVPVLTLAGVLLFAVGSAQAKPGQLDPTFGHLGKVTTAIGSKAGAYGVALQPNGKIVAAGYTGSDPSTTFALARYNRNGSLDKGFGADGRVTTAIGAGSRAWSVAVQRNGKIVAAGDTGQFPDSRVAVARYNPGGSLDAGFDGDGTVATEVGLGAVASAVALQPDGKIVVAGAASNGSTSDFALVRYNPNGSLDPSFGEGGKVTTSVGSSYDVAASVAIQPDGKIVVAGTARDASRPYFALARYQPDGSLDASFGTEGTVTTAIGREAVSSDVALQPDGRAVAAGYTENGLNYDFALARYKPNGSLDPMFGKGGKVTTAIGPNHDLAFALVLQPDGKLVAGGFAEGLTGDHFALARYRGNGVLDRSFGGDGTITTAIGPASGLDALRLQPDGKLVAVGQTLKGPNVEFALARYLTGNERCVVPNVVRKRLAKAKRAIRRAYCRIGRVKRVGSANVKRGRVISQRPEPGVRRPVGARVRLVVSTGSATASGA